MPDIKSTLTAMAKDLREGESVSKSHRIPIEDIKTSKLTKILGGMRNTMNQIASRAREATNREFRVESGQFMSYDGSAIILTCALTCMEDEGEDDI